MDDQGREYSTAELLELAAGAGYEVTSVQVAQWHRFGLLPRPRKQPLGKGKGSVSLYPSGAGPWLLDLLRVHEEERRLPYVAWRLWWAHRPIPLSRVREFMGRVATKVDQQHEAIAEQSAEEREAAAERQHRKELAPDARPGIGRVRQRLRRDSPLFFRVLFEALSGPFDPTEEQLRILQKGSGLARMRGCKPASEPLPELNASAKATLAAWTEAVRQPLGPLVDGLTDEELLAARDGVQALFAQLQGYVQASRELRVKGSLVVTDWYPPEDVASQVAFVLTWQSVRENAQKNAEAVHPEVASAAAGDIAEVYETIRALRKSTTFADLLTPSRLQEAMASPTSRERFLKELRILLVQNQTEAKALLQRAGHMSD